MVQEAGQPEIFRSAQRDEVFLKSLTDAASDVTQGFLGLPVWIRWRERIRIATKLTYYSLTTLGNLQTLGEEYTGIVHWTSDEKLPSKTMQAAMVLLDCFGEKFLLSLIAKFERYLEALPPEHPLRPEAKASLLKACDVLRRSLPYLQRFHKSIFYLQGRYYQFSKRLTGIRYALVRFWLRDRSVVPTFRLLGALSLAHQLGSAAVASRQLSKTPPTRETSGDDCAKSCDQCALCLNKRQHSTVTPCGHVFCWYCILPWVIEQPFCPLCRQEVLPSRVVLLRNYSS